MHGNVVPPRACMRAWTTADRSTYRQRRRGRTSTQDTAYANKLYATYRCCQWAQLRCHGDGRLCTGALPGFYIGWLLQKLSAKAFFRKKVDDLFSRRLQNFTVLNKAGPMSQQSQFFLKKIHSIDGWGHAPPPDPTLAMTLATQCNTLRLLPYSDAVCVNAAAVSALLMTLPRTGRFLTVRLLPWDTTVETRISVN